MADFFWFSHAQWARIEPLLPTGTRGMKRVDDRRVLSGLVHALHSGGRWGDCPRAYGPKKTLYNPVLSFAEGGYDSGELRDWLASRGTQAVIPPKRNRKVQLDCDHAIYKQRNVVERMFCRFKDWRRVATRYDRNIKTFIATIAIAATVIWWLK